MKKVISSNKYYLDLLIRIRCDKVIACAPVETLYAGGTANWTDV